MGNNTSTTASTQSVVPVVASDAAATVRLETTKDRRVYTPEEMAALTVQREAYSDEKLKASIGQVLQHGEYVHGSTYTKEVSFDKLVDDRQTSMLAEIGFHLSDCEEGKRARYEMCGGDAREVERYLGHNCKVRFTVA